MDTDKKKLELLEKGITEKVLGASFKVLNTLGSGFLEKVYENALTLELRNEKLSVEQQRPLQITYAGSPVGEYRADLVINNRVLLEIKAAKQLDPTHEAQLINYLKAAGIRVGLLLNFGRPKLQYKRLVI
jgi:GxxExxY protein